jgi:hypothetical protein
VREREKKGREQSHSPTEKKLNDEKKRATRDHSGYDGKQLHAPITDAEQLRDQEIEIQIKIGGFYPPLYYQRCVPEKVERSMEQSKTIVECEYFVRIGTQGKISDSK